ncbi:LuxR C-terminal-related transcriptional regulator [Microbacterium horticulturae]|uniref:LuxR C-terminal-related transcriptional regulator n=1 Tax=Microbacterium horticulturae TaxID=3028316 RepID=A0ABY8BZI0_9MICO|nr:LuxR C-terminal-related transcriptional regulator [Microbacterium sp. KACC 23027]WEG09610.1 LuxR C-terminal-related transcriptional regulator [Microbacterium sp. KACC 23027]
MTRLGAVARSLTSPYARALTEPVAAAVLFVWWLAGPARPIMQDLGMIPGRSDMSVTNVYAILVAAAFAASLALARLSPFLSVALAALAVLAQVAGWASRFSLTGWVAYGILLAVVAAVSVHAKGRMRVLAVCVGLVLIPMVAALLTLPPLSLSGQWGLINGKPWGSGEIVVGFAVWTGTQLVLTSAIWFLPAWLRSLRRAESQPADAAGTALSALSFREREVYLWVASGMTNSEIATAAHIEESTVKTHISKVLAKLELTSRVGIIAHAYRTGILLPEPA